MGGKRRQPMPARERAAWQALRDFARKDNARGGELAAKVADLLGVEDGADGAE